MSRKRFYRRLTIFKRVLLNSEVMEAQIKHICASCLNCFMKWTAHHQECRFLHRTTQGVSQVAVFLVEIKSCYCKLNYCEVVAEIKYRCASSTMVTVQKRCNHKCCHVPQTTRLLCFCFLKSDNTKTFSLNWLLNNCTSLQASRSRQASHGHMIIKHSEVPVLITSGKWLWNLEQKKSTLWSHTGK